MVIRNFKIIFYFLSLIGFNFSNAHAQLSTFHDNLNEQVRFSSIQNSLTDARNCLAYQDTTACSIINIVKNNGKLPLLGIRKPTFETDQIMGIASPIVFNTTEKDENDEVTEVYSPEIPISSNKKVSGTVNDIKFFPSQIVYSHYYEFINYNVLESNSTIYYDTEAQKLNQNSVGIPRRYTIDKIGGEYFLKLLIDLHSPVEGNNVNVGAALFLRDFSYVQIFDVSQLEGIRNLSNNILMNKSLIAQNNCQMQDFSLLCHVGLFEAPRLTLENIVLGYGIYDNHDSFPAENDQYDTNLELLAYYYMYYEDGSENKFPVWRAKDNIFKNYSRHPRRILEEDLGFTILTEISSGEEYGYQSNRLLFSDQDHSSYVTINYEDTSLQIYSTEDHSLLNTLEFDSYGDGHFHSMRVAGRHLEFISKTEVHHGDSDPLAHRFDDCISFTQIPEEDHRLLIENDNYVFKAGELTVWEKRPEHTEPKCHFPTSGQSNLAVGQELIQYNTILEGNANKLTYLLNGDMVTIKDDGVLKVIRIDANGHFDPNNPANIVQTFDLQ